MNGDFREDLKRACEVMQKGGVILYPTDTIWGIGCDATNPEAVKRVYDIKNWNFMSVIRELESNLINSVLFLIVL